VCRLKPSPKGEKVKISTSLRLCTSVAALVTAAATAAHAQQPASTETVTVTGTRITNGAAMPTPVTTVDTNELLTQSPVSIPDALMQLPQFATTTNARTQVMSNGRGYGTPTPGFNLYGLGTIRTLVLMDGNRVPGTFYDTTVNADMLPQMLVQRVDVVTGGASAVYGSDAVAGVVNYVLDHNFNGFKGLAQGGISDYGDAKSFRLGAAVGFNLFDRGHFEASAEYYNSDAVPDAATRPYGASSCALTGNGTSNPYVMSCNLRQANTSPYGLITNGPMAGMQFSADGKSIVPFNPGTPTKTANINVGGDGGVLSHETLIPTNHVFHSYARFDYDISDDLSAYIDARYGSDYTIGASQGYTNTDGQYPMWIYSGNAFLTPAQQAALFPAGTTSVDVARFDNDIMRKLTIRQLTTTTAVSAGIKGTTFGDFTWDAHFTHGQNHVNLTTFNNVNTANFYAALDAVVDPVTGKTVCNVSLTAPGTFPGCTPINLFGQNNASKAAQDYIFGNTWWVAANSMDDFAANLTGTLFEGWAGPVKTAIGVEYRTQGLTVTSSTPDPTFNPQYLRLGPNGTSTPGSYPRSNLAWFKEVQSPADGHEGISEGDIELDAPLLKDLPFAELVSLNAAYRYTSYSTSGEGAHSTFSANTWKVGLEWSVNDDVRFRLSESRDMRAPTLWDLYQEQEISSSGISDPLTQLAGSANTVVGGNPNLKPEVSYNYTAGVVLTPTFIPNLTASVDYYHIKINNAIGSVGGLNTTIYDLCQSTGDPQYCGLVVRPGAYNDPSPGNFPITIFNLSQNVALAEVEGFNTEISYFNDLSGWTDMNGTVNLRLFWTHQPVRSSQSLPGTLISNASGTTGAPRDRVNVTLGYNLDNFTVSVVESYIAPSNWQSNPPQRIYNLPKIRDYALTDVNLSYAFTVEDTPTSAFLNVSNLWNDHGPLTGGWTGSPGMLYPVPTYADIIGRYFTVGLRVNM
jgi:outer membrane receptor protein involved in Fe transport